MKYTETQTSTNRAKSCHVLLSCDQDKEFKKNEFAIPMVRAHVRRRSGQTNYLLDLNFTLQVSQS